MLPSPAGWAPTRLLLASLRRFSTQPASPTLKAKLRELYKKVHPDFFQDPVAKEANERSFKLLQEYVAASKTGGGIGRTAGLPYHFVFYLHTEEAQAGEPAGAEATEAASDEGGEPAGSLKKVALTLPPPARASPGESLSPATRKAFSRLLAACGIFDDPSAVTPEAQPYSRLVSLREFIPLAAEQVHQAAAAGVGPRHQLGAARTALRLGRGVALGFGEPLVAAGPVEQLAAAQQLVAALDALAGLELRGLKVVVGGGYGVDALGCIWLHAGDSQAAWMRYLSSVDTRHCHDRQAMLQQVKAQEAAVARALHIALLYTHPQLSLDAQYLAFLQRTAAAAAERGAVGGGRFADVAVMVQPDPSQVLGAEQPGGEGDQGASMARAAAGAGAAGAAGAGAEGSSRDELLGEASIDDATGVVQVPVGSSAAELYSAIQRLGPAAQAVAARGREEEAAAATLRTAVERKLRLRRLVRDPGLAADKYRAACLRLMQHSGALGPLLEGLAVQVGEVNGLSPDRTLIHIAWNFQP